MALNLPKTTRVLPDSASATIASLLGQAAGLLVAPMTAFLFGATSRTDDVFLALAVANFLTTTLSGASQFAVVPFLVESRIQRANAADFLVPLTQLLTLVSAILAAVISVAAALYVYYKAPQYTAAMMFLWWLCPFVSMATVAGLQVGALNAHREYWSAAVSPAWRWAAVLMCMLLLGPALGIASLLVGYTLGEAVRLVYLARKLATYYSDINWLSVPRVALPALLPFVRNGAAQIVGSAILALAPVIDRQIAGTLPAGSISILEYADRLWQIPVGFAMSGVLVVILSNWSHALAANVSAGHLAIQTRRIATRLALAAVLPTLVAFLLRQPLIDLLFAHGNFPASGLPVLANTFGVYLVLIPIYLAGMTYSRAFLALKRSDYLLVVAVAQITLKLVLNGPMVRAFGLPGLAGATAIMYVLGLALLAVRLHHNTAAVSEGN